MKSITVAELRRHVSRAHDALERIDYARIAAWKDADYGELRGDLRCRSSSRSGRRQSLCGNAVPPHLAAAIIGANLTRREETGDLLWQAETTA